MSDLSATLAPAVTAATSLPIDYDKRLMLFSGRANPELASRIADKLGVDLGPVTLKTFTNGEVYRELGGDYYQRRDPERQIRRLITQLERLGQHVTVEAATA